MRGGTVERTTLAGGTLTLSGDTLDATMRWLYQRFDTATGALIERCVTDSAVRVTR